MGVKYFSIRVVQLVTDQSYDNEFGPGKASVDQTVMDPYEN